MQNAEICWNENFLKLLKKKLLFTIMYNGELLTFADFNQEHRRCLEFIKQEVDKSKSRYKIVVSHHVPSYLMQCPKFADSHANGAFIVELKDFIEQSNIDFWIFGHSHYNIDKVIGKTTCLSNQLGYVFHNEHKSLKASGQTHIGFCRIPV